MEELLVERVKDEVSETGLTGEEMIRISQSHESQWESKDEVGRCMRY